MRNNQFKIKLFSFVAGLFIFGPACVFAATENRIINPGFESVIGDGTNWDNTANRGISTPIVADAPQGSRVLRLTENDIVAPQDFTFTFQTVSPAKAGDVVTFSSVARQVAIDGDDVGQIRIEFQTAAGTFISDSITAVTSGTFTRITASGTAPAGTGQVTFTLRIQNAQRGDGTGTTSVIEFDDVVGTINAYPLILESQPSSVTAPTGGMKMVSLRVRNLTAITQPGVEVIVEPQAGINIQNRSGAFDNRRVPSREGSVIFAIGNMEPGLDSVLAFPIILTSAVVPGKTYDITAHARNLTGSLSQEIHIQVMAKLDPVFDEGTIIGKVFNDLNKNGVQDGCSYVGTEELCSGKESGVPWVRLATEEGIVVVTDEHGRYHIPAVKPGRHLVKIDGRTLPDGTRFITEENVLVKTTPGILNKANFAVLVPPSEIPKQFQKDLLVSITQGVDTSLPTLAVTMDPYTLRTGVGVLERNPTFKFKINYPELVKSWYLEIRDDMGREIWTGYGISQPPPEVLWTGQTEQGLLIKPGVYSYQLKVEDHQGRQDWTPLNFFQVIAKTDKNWAENPQMKISPIGDFNLFKDGKSSIPMVAKPTVRVQGKTNPGYKVKINTRDVEVDPEGLFQTEMYVTPGQKDITVDAISPDGETTSYRKSVKVKDSTFFMVALGEEQLGTNFQDGDARTLAVDDTYRAGFYESGRLSYFLTGKLKGKFLVKSHFDTDDKRSALFRNLDPDQYYPVYGDSSTRNYDAINTLQRFYTVVEFDKSYAKWGSYRTEFSDTELSTYNRSLSGLKVNHDSVGTTPYGDSKRGVKAFYAQAKHRADHNEFAATGGSLYYLRNRNVIEGSEQLRVEVRDKLQDIAIQSKDLVEGQDYEIDYTQGRILLSRPLSSVAASDTLISNDLMDGNTVYLIADYEYDAGFDAFNTPDRGIRGYTHMGNHFKVGGTLVEEKRQSMNDYDMRGLDATLKLGRNTKVIAEYAETKLKQTDQNVSYNGGLTFANRELLRGPSTQPREDAFLLKAQSKPTKKMNFDAYVQKVDPGFSNERLASQEGFRKYGMNTSYHFAKNLYGRYRFDQSDLENELQPLNLTPYLASSERLRTNTAQLVYDDAKYLAELEYRNQKSEFPVGSTFDTLLSEFSPNHAVAGKLGYHINDRLMPYAKVQTAVNGRKNNQFGGGVRVQVVNNLYAYLEEMFGHYGDSTYFGFEQFHDNGARQYANLKMLDRGIGRSTLASAVGSSFALSENSRVFSERQNSEYQGIDGYADILGYNGQPGDNWDFDAKYERRRLDAKRSEIFENEALAGLARNNHSNVWSGAVGYADRKKLRARTMLEVNLGNDVPKVRQWVSRNSVEYKINQDLSHLTKLDYGNSLFLEPHDQTASFTEFSTGFAYRPVDNDRFNALTRYTYLNDIGNDVQFASPLFNGIEQDETAHILAIDLAYDIHRYIGLVEKLGYKQATLNSNAIDELILHNFLWVNRLNFHVTRKWDVALEYRTLWQFDIAQTFKQGALIEIDREIYEYVRLGAGYNFTDFSDDLRKSNNVNSHGPFVRMTGKF